MSTFTPSKYQQSIFNWISDGKGHAVCNAVAGSGKSTTLKEAAKLLPPTADAQFVAFNTHIVAALNADLVGTPMKAVTVHSAGRSALAKVIQIQGAPDTKKYNKIVKGIFDRRHINAGYQVTSAIIKLVDQARNSLVNPRDFDALEALAARFDLLDDLDEAYLPFVNDALKTGESQARNAGLIDFTDMIYLPVQWGLTPAQGDWVFGDEIQDWNAAQLELVCRMVRKDGRFLGVGDPRQSIMAFAGADDESFWKIKSRLNAVELPLSVCYRCPKKHVMLAQDLVPNIESHEANIDGIVTYEKETNLFTLVKPGDLILCRKTAPLVSACIALIGQGVAARVRGRNVGKTLTDLARTVSKMTAFEVDKFLKFLDEYYQTQVAFLSAKEDTEEQIENLTDRVNALTACFRRYYTKKASFDGILAEIEALFSDDNPGVWLSTIHRAKGLEADRVMILEFANLPLIWKNQQPYQYAQELNLKYVALTRAKKELILFASEPKPIETPAIQQSLVLENSISGSARDIDKLMESLSNYNGDGLGGWSSSDIEDEDIDDSVFAEITKHILSKPAEIAPISQPLVIDIRSHLIVAPCPIALNLRIGESYPGESTLKTLDAFEFDETPAKTAPLSKPELEYEKREDGQTYITRDCRVRWLKWQISVYEAARDEKPLTPDHASMLRIMHERLNEQLEVVYA